MEINKLKDLKENGLFSAIAELQVFLDDQDAVLRDSGMTRSPIHTLAFMILWTGLEHRADKERVVQNFNELAEQYPLLLHGPDVITVEKLDTLSKNIDWSALIHEAIAQEANKTSLGVKIEVPQVENFLSKIAKVNANLHQTLIEHDLIKKSDRPDKLCVTTTVKQNVRWRQAFAETVVLNQDNEVVPAWKVPKSAFWISENLRQKLEQISHSGRYGNFEITAGDPNDVKVYIYTKNLHAEKQALCFDFEEQEVNSGIYNVFISTKLAGMYLPVENVIVKLACEAALDKLGAEVKQTQKVLILDGCCPNFEKQEPMWIGIDPVLFFNDAGIQVPFTDTKHSLQNIPLLDAHDVIHLRTADPTQWVSCLPATYLASDAFHKMIQPTQVNAEITEKLEAEEKYMAWQKEMQSIERPRKRGMLNPLNA